jgi:hypothetical protein
MEYFRQTGIVVAVAETLVIVFATMNGMSIMAYWRKLDRLTKAMLAVFLSSIWIGATYYSPSRLSRRC